jgi:hypothetical protein
MPGCLLLLTVRCLGDPAVVPGDGNTVRARPPGLLSNGYRRVKTIIGSHLILRSYASTPPRPLCLSGVVLHQR